MSIFIEAKEISKNEPYKLIDTRFSLFDVNEGFEMYKATHIDGAIYWDLNKDLSDLSSNVGRHPMPSKDHLKALFERSGLELDDVIYIYDQGGAPYASRAWFMLNYAGFANVKIVNGGYAALIDAGFLESSELPDVLPSVLDLQFNDLLVATKEQVRQVTVGERNGVLLDARSYERYVGEVEPLDPIAGHIPTAQNFNWEHLVRDRRFEHNEELHNRFEKDEAYIVYCGSGVTASPLFVTMYNEGYEDIQLYVGSYSDWITSYPVATGDENKKK